MKIVEVHYVDGNGSEQTISQTFADNVAMTNYGTFITWSDNEGTSDQETMAIAHSCLLYFTVLDTND